MRTKWRAYDTIFCRGEDFDNSLKPYEIADILNRQEDEMKFDVELTAVYEDGALVTVEGKDWIVAIPFTLEDNRVTINTDELELPDDLIISGS